ncbi:AAA family ATPase, CDC48 subfamily [Isosphaera pallida ATCC 43644]|uniref:AAA family ATPase, CDC48 subfamily n=1 Tax=Isosphaera pallida (strain ATCC 43644 / DSM 9630 / IS1B) TaxID=575540 RepID=E8QYP4_ISOPI|nr:AAA family ATPase [Isosphaera pallida]ADV61020.1 AAA family ATPase, CDC48 subfamily [Isosphaera pallida ATCC 43644]
MNPTDSTSPRTHHEPAVGSDSLSNSSESLSANSSPTPPDRDASANDHATASPSTKTPFKVAEARPRDQGRGLARLDPADLEALGAAPGAVVEIVGTRRTVARAMPAYPEDRERRRVHLDATTRDNAGVALDDLVRVRVVPFTIAEKVGLVPLGDFPDDRDLQYLGARFDGLALIAGDLVRIRMIGGALREFEVRSVEPPGPVVVGPDSTLELQRPPSSSSSSRSRAGSPRVGDASDGHGHDDASDSGIWGFARSGGLGSPRRAAVWSSGSSSSSLGGGAARSSIPRRPRGGFSSSAGRGGRTVRYEDVGGLKRELNRIRELIELPLRHPEVFQRLGIDPPQGVLLHGPPGCGKTLIARAVAAESDAAFFAVNGPEIVHKFYGESEAHLRRIFDEAARSAPSIIFLDEIDAIAPKRENAVGEVEKRIVAQLLALMDGMNRRGRVLVLAATNLPNNLDPALRRPGRFDREIALPIPDREGRRDILDVHTRGMPLDDDVDLDQLAAITHGFVGADLEALCREAAMVRLRRLMPAIDFDSGALPYNQLKTLKIGMEDFQLALRDIEPSAIREVFVEVPEVSWADVGGLAEVRQRLIEAVEWPLRHPDLFASFQARPPRGILLHGPPGCGKTLIAKAIARESQANFIPVKGPALLSKYVGDSEKAVREVFRKARQAAPCILFFDEIDALVPTRGEGGGSDSQVAERVVGQFLAELDGIEDLGGVLVLAATNRVDRIDPALRRPGRFDLIVEVPAPNRDDRRAILAIGLRDMPLDPAVSLDELAEVSEGLTGADLRAVCHEAARRVIRRIVAQREAGSVATTTTLPKVARTDLLDAIAARKLDHASTAGSL